MRRFKTIIISFFILFLLGILFYFADKEIKNKEEKGITYQISRLIPESVKEFLKETLLLNLL